MDIQPGSGAGSNINLQGQANRKGKGGTGSSGKIAVAILSTDSFDASDVDATTITLGDEEDTDTPIATKKNGSPQLGFEDVDEDGILDLVAHFDKTALIENGDLDASTTQLCVNGATSAGRLVHGCDLVRIVP